MSEYTDLTAAIAEQIKDYRQGEIEPRTPDVVDRWARQFDSNVRLPLLKEVNHVFDSTYWSRDDFDGFLESLISAQKLVGESKEAFWRAANFLAIQQHGNSQTEMLEIFDEKLLCKCNFGIGECGQSTDTFIYLDDAIFSGNRVRQDVQSWLKNTAPAKATLHVVAIALHSSADWYIQKELNKVAADNAKDVEIQFWRALTIENRKSFSSTSQVLWPASLFDDDAVILLNDAQRFPLEPRKPGAKIKDDIFSSEDARTLLEREMLMAGMRIRSFSANPSASLMPLGFGGFGLGFGATIISFRNCPNNCPLALWWGNPDYPQRDHPFTKWFPLLPRKT